MTDTTPSLWSLDPWTLAAIAVMTAATFGTRAGGYLIFRQIKPTPALRAMLSYIPGALFISYVAPALAHGSRHAWVGAVTTVLIMVTTGRTATAILGGTAAAWLAWSWL